MRWDCCTGADPRGECLQTGVRTTGCVALGSTRPVSSTRRQPIETDLHARQQRLVRRVLAREQRVAADPAEPCTDTGCCRVATPRRRTRPNASTRRQCAWNSRPPARTNGWATRDTPTSTGAWTGCSPEHAKPADPGETDVRRDRSVSGAGREEHQGADLDAFARRRIGRRRRIFERRVEGQPRAAVIRAVMHPDQEHLVGLHG